MRKLLFLLISMTVAVSASAGVNTFKMKQTAKNPQKNAIEKMVRTSDHMMPATNLRFMAPAKADVPDGYAAVTLTAPDIWGDGSGYQMLLDANATAYGNVFPETGPLTDSGDASASVYAEFEYKIPENADGSTSTQNIVLDGSVTILIPAGTYDWCIVNPTPGDRVWISGNNGNIGGRANDFNFASGLTYVFTIGVFGQNDGVDLSVLEPGVSLTVPENLTVNPGSTTADVAWEDNDDIAWNLRYRPFVDTSNGAFSEDLNNDDIDALIANLGDWIIYDADGDGDYWGIGYGEAGAAPDYCFQSDSYYNGTAYDPDQYLISPEVNLGGVLRFRMKGVGSWPDNIRIYVIPDLDNITSLDDLAAYPLTDDLSTPGSWTSYEFSLSAWEGTTGRIAFRHYNSEDNYYVKIDDIFIGDPNAPVIEPEPWVVVEGLVGTEYTITGLTPETEYEVQVQAAGSYGASDWTSIVNFFTLAEGPAIPDVYMLGGNDQPWDCTTGTKFEYDAEENIYTLNYTFEADPSYFSFTTALAENNDDGGWNYIEPFRFGAISEGDYWYTGEEDFISLTWDEYHAIRIPAGEYNMIVDLANMKLIIEPVAAPHNYEPGDVNHDGAVNISDVTGLIDHLLGTGDGCPICADVNVDGAVNISDVTALIDKLLAN